MIGLPSRLSSRRRLGSAQGFSLVEMLLVLALIGIISAIAIPSYMGQRRRARVIGDAISNAKVLQMGLETRRAEVGIYGPVATYDWMADGSIAADEVTVMGQRATNLRACYNHDPTDLVTIGNPPSGAAGGYGWFDLAAVLAGPAVLRLPTRRLHPRG